MQRRIDSLDWHEVAGRMNTTGFAVLDNLLTPRECDELKNLYDQDDLYRKTISMERYRFGLGEYKYFSYPLPAIIEQLRQAVYPRLAPIANKWMEVLNIETRFPDTHAELIELCHDHDQNRPTPLILRYSKGGYNTLHQDLFGEVFFPMQMVLFLDEPGRDYEGGEFVLIEQQLRAQSKAIVLKPRKGDILVFTTNFRPVKGSRGY